MQKKTIILIVVFILIVGTALFLIKGKSSNTLSSVLQVQSGEVVMHMGENSYEPVNIKIKIGTKVTFINDSNDYRWPASDLHPSHLIFPEFDSKKALAPGENFSFTFEKVGEWGYHDHLAPYITGVITVVE